MKREKKTPATDDRVWVLNPFTKKPMHAKRATVKDVEKARQALLRAGFDPDTGEPKG